MSPTLPIIVTTMNSEGYARYGLRMLASLRGYLSPGIRFMLFAEGFLPEPGVLPPTSTVFDLDASAPWLADFKAWCEEDPVRCGVIKYGYNMRWDAQRFAHKIAAFTAAVRLFPEARMLWWFDADTVAHAHVTPGWLADLLPEDAYIAWLDRLSLYPECGVFGVRPTHPFHRQLWAEVLSLYETRSLIQYPEWHDSYLIQQVVEQAAREGSIPPPASLSGAQGRATPHPLVNGPLGARLDHLKGPRKGGARSYPTDLRFARSEPYWTDTL